MCCSATGRFWTAGSGRCVSDWKAWRTCCRGCSGPAGPAKVTCSGVQAFGRAHRSGEKVSRAEVEFGGQGGTRNRGPRSLSPHHRRAGRRRRARYGPVDAGVEAGTGGPAIQSAKQEPGQSREPAVARECCEEARLPGSAVVHLHTGAREGPGRSGGDRKAHGDRLETPAGRAFRHVSAAGIQRSSVAAQTASIEPSRTSGRRAGRWSVCSRNRGADRECGTRQARYDFREIGSCSRPERDCGAPPAYHRIACTNWATGQGTRTDSTGRHSSEESNRASASPDYARRNCAPRSGRWSWATAWGSGTIPRATWPRPTSGRGSRRSATIRARSLALPPTPGS